MGRAAAPWAWSRAALLLASACSGTAGEAPGGGPTGAAADTAPASADDGPGADSGAGGGTGSGAGTDTGADAADPAGAGRAPLDSERPGGWSAASFVFSQARLGEDGVNDDWVALGWLELDASAVGEACGGSGPRARRVAQRWGHDEDYPQGTCDRDRKHGVDFRRWDHTPVAVDACPGAGAWVEADGTPTDEPFLFDCPAHVPAGYGAPEEQAVWEGWYGYEAGTRTLTLRYEVAGHCRKEYYAALTHDADGRLLAMALDGGRTGDTSSAARGTGATHGYAYGSSAPVTAVAPLDEAMRVVREAEILADTWRLREGREDGPPLDHQHEDTVLGYAPATCGADVYFDHSCVAADGQAPYLADCVGGEGDRAETAYLRFWLDPFPDQATREHLAWAWHAHHAPNWTGCYHRGSHASPLLQIIDSDGAFRGYVGVEIQRSAQTSGQGQVPEDAWRETDYRVFRWVQAGFEELEAPPGEAPPAG
jgi:hypothetical protein